MAFIVDAALTTASPDLAATITSVKVLGGTSGDKYTITNKITTTDGMVDRRSMLVRVFDR